MKYVERTPRSAQPNLMPTLLERLKDEQPGRSRENPADWAVSASHMRELVRDNLIDILNAINLEPEVDLSRYPHAAASVLNFGIPPLAGRYLSELRWSDIEKNIRLAVLRFEPRIIAETLRISPPPDMDKERTGNTLRFIIQGMIVMDPHPLELILQSQFDLETSAFEGVLLKE